MEDKRISLAYHVCYPGIHVWLRDDGTNRETTGMDMKNRGSEET